MGTRVAGLSDRRMTPGGFTRVLSASGGCAPPGQQASVSTTQGRKGTWGTGPWPVAGLQMSPAARESRLQLRVKVTIDAPCPRSPRRIQTPCAPAVPGLVCPPSPGSAGSCTGGAPGFSGPVFVKEEPQLPQRPSIYRGGQYRAVYSLRAIQLTGYIPAIIRVGS